MEAGFIGYRFRFRYLSRFRYGYLNRWCFQNRCHSGGF
jgi:hypothetical protein